MKNVTFTVNPAVHAAAPMVPGKTYFGMTPPIAVPFTSVLDRPIEAIRAEYLALRDKLTSAEVQIVLLRQQLHAANQDVLTQANKLLAAEARLEKIREHANGT